MVAPLVAAAGIGAAGSLIGGITGGKGAQKAAQIQQKTTQQQIAALQKNQQYISGLEAPTIDRGNQAGSLTANFLGMNGGTAAADALGTYRDSTGYSDLVKEGLGAVNSNAYARGMGDSGAALKALQSRGMSIADRSSSDWLGRLGQLQQLGQQAIGNVAGVATNTTNNINAANQTGADAQGNAALVGSAAWQKALQGLVNTGSYAMGSSFGGGSGQVNPYGVMPRSGFGGGIY
jgi:hypothetical protein